MAPQKGPSRSGGGRLVFILGHPVSHSLSPRMHNAAFRSLGLPWLYVPLDLLPHQLKPFLRSMKDLPAQGANVTVPYKERILGALDGIDPEARRLGSINTIYRKGNKLLGTSTDGPGFIRALGPWGKGLRGSTGLVLGSGGAGRAVAFALAGCGVGTLLISNRSPRSSDQLSRALRFAYPRAKIGILSLKEAGSALPRCDWVVQATSLGLKNGDKSPISLAGIRPASWVVDLIYHRETSFLRDARRRGVRAMDGTGMLLHQGILSFERWTGRRAPMEIMRRSLLGLLSRKA